jgi:hypothetical protein
MDRWDPVPGVDHGVTERRMLLDDYLPEFDVRTSYAARIAASPARVYTSLWTANFDHWGVTRALYAVRTLPSFPARPRETWRRLRDELFPQRFTLDGMLSEGFALLGERPGEEFVLGTVGRFWACPWRTVRNQPSSIPCTGTFGNRKGGMELRSGYTGGRRHGVEDRDSSIVRGCRDKAPLSCVLDVDQTIQWPDTTGDAGRGSKRSGIGLEPKC